MLSWILVNYVNHKMSQCKSESKLEELATTIEQWILQFWEDTCANKTRLYNEIADGLWQFIWICISELRHYNCFLYYLRKEPCEKSFTVDTTVERLEMFGGFDWEWMKREALREFIKMFETRTLFTIGVVDGRDEQVKPDEQTKQELIIRTVCPGKSQEYTYFLSCLFPSIEFGSFYTAGNDHEMTSLRYTKKRKPIEAYARWSMLPDVYQECLQLFPRWPLKMSPEWFLGVRAILEIPLLPDLVSICFMYLQIL